MSDLIKETLDKIAAEKFANDPAGAEEFKKGFQEKMAAWDNPRMGGLGGDDKKNDRSPTFSGSVTKGLGEALGKGVIGAGLGLGIAGVAKLVGGVQQQSLHNKFLQALTEAVQMSPILKKTDKQRLLSYGETLFKYAPNVATDANMLVHLLSSAVQGDGLDTNIIRMATDLDGRYRQNTQMDLRNFS